MDYSDLFSIDFKQKVSEFSDLYKRGREDIVGITYQSYNQATRGICGKFNTTLFRKMRMMVDIYDELSASLHRIPKTTEFVDAVIENYRYHVESFGINIDDIIEPNHVEQDSEYHYFSELAEENMHFRWYLCTIYFGVY